VVLTCILYVTFSAQPAGVPEILKKSLHSCSVAGGDEVFIIGKNFLKGTKVLFQENSTGTSYTIKALTLYWVLYGNDGIALHTFVALVTFQKGMTH